MISTFNINAYRLTIDGGDYERASIFFPINA